MKQNKENNIYYNSHEENGENGENRYPVIETNQQRFIAELLIHWREHIAKMLDSQPIQVLTF